MNKQKNLLFVFADQWRGSAVGFAGEDPVHTPRMDAFCRESTWCDHAFSTFPLCSPHRASLLTGRYPLSTGFYTNCKPGTDVRLQDDELCIGQVLKEGGYQTGYIGKWHLDEPEVNHDPAPASGARDWDAFTPPGVRRHGFDYWYSYGTWDMHLDPHYWQDTPQWVRPGKWSPEHETDVALDYLKNVSRDQPFALFVSWNPPHSPYDQVPDRYLAQYGEVPFRGNVQPEHLQHHTWEQVPGGEENLQRMTRQYYAAITGLDEQFGRLLDGLDQLGLAEDTIVVLSADHGDMMGSHGLMGKHVWFEESIRIPLMIRIPGNRKLTCHTCMGSQDMMPTLLSLLSLPIPETVEGEDCSVWLTTPAENPDRVSFLCACPGRDIFQKPFADRGLNAMDFGWRGVRTARYTYVMELGYAPDEEPRRFLYDNEADPLQVHPLSLDGPETRQLARELEEQVCGWMATQQDGFAVHWQERTHKL